MKTILSLRNFAHARGKKAQTKSVCHIRGTTALKAFYIYKLQRRHRFKIFVRCFLRSALCSMHNLKVVCGVYPGILEYKARSMSYKG